MKNYIQDGLNVTVAAAPYAVVAGACVLVGVGLFGVAAGTAASGAEVVLVTGGVFDLAKLEAQAWTVGAKVYWDNTAKLCTTVSTSNTLIGVAIDAAANPTTIGRVRLNGSIA